MNIHSASESMSVIESLILGIVQALTEFLPVSSSGHLVIAQHILGTSPTGDAAFEVAVHLGTLFSILVVLRTEIFTLCSGLLSAQYRHKSWREDMTFIILSAIPAGVIGVLFKDDLESAFSNLWGVGVALIFTGAVLLSTRKLSGQRQNITLLDTLSIGLAQAIAILPGISRSGSTISVALWLGIERERAAKLSFLMSLPVIGGAGLLKGLDLMEHPLSTELFQPLIVGTASSFIFGLFALSWMLKWISRPSFAYFGIYCLVAGLIAMAMVI